SSRRRHTRFSRDWSSDVCSSDLGSASTPSGESQDFRNADLQIDIAGLTLRNGQIHLHDKKHGYVGHVTNLELNTGRMTADQPFRSEERRVGKGLRREEDGH